MSVRLLWIACPAIRGVLSSKSWTKSLSQKNSYQFNSFNAQTLVYFQSDLRNFFGKDRKAKSCSSPFKCCGAKNEKDAFERIRIVQLRIEETTQGLRIHLQCINQVDFTVSLNIQIFIREKSFLCIIVEKFTLREQIEIQNH